MKTCRAPCGGVSQVTRTINPGRGGGGRQPRQWGEGASAHGGCESGGRRRRLRRRSGARRSVKALMAVLAAAAAHLPRVARTRPFRVTAGRRAGPKRQSVPRRSSTISCAGSGAAVGGQGSAGIGSQGGGAVGRPPSRRRRCCRQWPEVSDFVALFCTLRESENTRPCENCTRNKSYTSRFILTCPGCRFSRCWSAEQISLRAS